MCKFIAHFFHILLYIIFIAPKKWLIGLLLCVILPIACGLAKFFNVFESYFLNIPISFLTIISILLCAFIQYNFFYTKN